MDVGEEDGADDAAAHPEGGDGGKVEGVFVLFRGLAHHHEALRIAYDL